MAFSVFQPDLRSLTAQYITRYVSQYVNVKRQFGSSLPEIQAYQQMAKKDPVTRFSMELVFLYVYAQIQDYSHPRSRIQKEVRASINGMKGTWAIKFKEIMSALWYGYSWTEVASMDTPTGRKRIKRLRTLDPARYTFTGPEEKLELVRYTGTNGTIDLDYNTGIHIVCGSDISFDENHGSGRFEPALPYWELEQLIMPVLAIATQRQATPILVKKTETSETVAVLSEDGIPMTDSLGNPIEIPKGLDAIRQLSELGSAGVTAIDPDDEIYSIDQNVAGDFLLSVVQLCEQRRMMAYLVPPTVFSISSSGVGDSGLSERHLAVFEMLNEGVAYFFTEEIVEQLLRPFIVYNFGEQENYGMFPIDRSNKEAVEIAEVIRKTFEDATFTKDDINALNKLRSTLGIPELTPQELDAMLLNSDRINQPA